MSLGGITYPIMIGDTPRIIVRHVEGYVEYHIQQGNEVINFYLDLDAHEALKIAQTQADALFQKQAPSGVALRLVSSE